jgi:hypothetical protein
LDKDRQVVRVLLARERRQTNFKTSRNATSFPGSSLLGTRLREMWEKRMDDILECGFAKGKRRIFIFNFI